ncbi:amino acid adenylation domain-containing protein [Roseivirga sp. BDSF3-8]|uniref:non-ribosomal peptide synthetase n=1 Tax=Roseivirga sp. BDSF3-8 TaxID=3241598 RepID=UPI0035322CE7
MQNLSKENIQNIYNLSPMQEGMYFHALLEEGTAYVQQVAYRVEGTLQPDLVKKTFEHLTARYDILRTVFVQKSTRDILQVVLREVEVDFAQEDISESDSKETALEQIKSREREKPFDLKKSVAFRLKVVKVDSHTYEVIWTYHHILMDGWSLAILLADFLDSYQAIEKGEKPVLPVARQFRDYVRWLGNQNGEDSQRFWKQYLQGYDRMARIPRHATKKEGTAYRPAHTTLAFDQKESQQLEKLATGAGVTVSLVFQALWGILLSRYQQQEDVVFGAVVSGRPADLPGIQNMPGMFINVIPVRLSPSPEETFTELLGSMQKEAAEALPHHYTPLVDVQRSSELTGGLFDHIMAFENYPIDERIAEGAQQEGSFRVTGFNLFEHTTYDFNLSVIPGDTLSIRFDFNLNVFTEEQLKDIAAQLKRIASQVTGNPAAKLKDIALLSEKQEADLLQVGRGEERPFDEKATLVSLFQKQVERTPDAIAIAGQEESFTYAQLADKARRVSQHLTRNGGVMPGDTVAIFMDRSADTIVSMLAIMYSGAAFVPVDTTYPDARKEHIVSQSECKALITHSNYLMDIGFFTGFLVALDVEADQLPDAAEIQASVAQDHNAYLIFTSGTTGWPKGVQVTHRNFVNYITWANDYYFNDEGGYNMPFFTSPSFDLTLTSIFSPLLRGGSIQLPQREAVQEVLSEVFGPGSPVQAVKLTPSHIRLLKNLNLSSSEVKKIIAGGEALKPDDIHTLLALNADMVIYNEYGPTETTVGASVKKIDREDTRINIGKPVANTRLYITDSRHTLLPYGATGEIVIAGEGVAKGYAGDDQATEAKFIKDPWGEGKAYLTGDLGRWLPGGMLAYEGRADEQVKVNGHRIEPGEVRSLLLEHASVNDAHVAVRLSPAGEPMLIAYYIADAAATEEALREHVGRSLPPYMVPRFLVEVQEIPLTANGKVDTTALPEPKEIVESRKAAYKAPASEPELFIASLFTKVLGAEKPGLNDDFFRLGGDSLKAIQLVNLSGERYPDVLQVGDVFNGATVGDLSAVINKRTGVEESAGQKEDFQEFEL